MKTDKEQAFKSLELCIDALSRNGKADPKAVAIWSNGQIDETALTLEKLITIYNLLSPDTFTFTKEELEDMKKDYPKNWVTKEEQAWNNAIDKLMEEK